MNGSIDLDPRTVRVLEHALDALVGKQQPMRHLPVFPNGIEAKTAEDVAVLLNTTPGIGALVLREVRYRKG